MQLTGKSVCGIAGLTLFFGIFAGHIKASTSFEYKIIDSAPMGTVWAKGTGDFNGDGRTDVVIGGRDTVIWYQNPGSAGGTWDKHTIYKGPDVGLEGCASGDIDNDGDVDIVIGGHYTHVVYCLENPGKGRGKWKLHNLGGPKTDSTYLFDFDGDGKLDIVTRASELASKGVGRDLYIWKQGNNAFDHTQWKRYTAPVGTGEHCNIGDVDQDGKIDILVGNKWLKNDGTINVGAWKQYTFTTAWTHDRTYPFVADIDGDGRNDIVLTPTERSDQTYKTAWYQAPAERTSSNWTEHIIENNIQCVTHALGVYDFDCDGDMDVFTAEMEQSKDPDEVRIYYNADGKGNIWEKQVIARTGSHWCQFLDIEGDGDMDIFGINHGSIIQPKAELWENRTKCLKLRK
jgi:hypothetical protein